MNAAEHQESVRAIVQRVIREGRHGAYAIATAESLTGSITFSLMSPVWQEPSWPDPGHLVLLSDIRAKRAGWRAHTGRFLRPSDGDLTARSTRAKE